MTDRRRVNGPVAGTRPPMFNSATSANTASASRLRRRDELRKIFLKPGLVPLASGSAYLELQDHTNNGNHRSFIHAPSSLKLACTVQGPKSIARSAAFSSNMTLSTHVKYGPFASQLRRGYTIDSTERQLAGHLESALHGLIMTDKWPKSGIEVSVIVLEDGQSKTLRPLNPTLAPADIGSSFGVMSVFSGCITVACAALLDAGIDCVDIVTGGIASLIPVSNPDPEDMQHDQREAYHLVLDPSFEEHSDVIATCVVGYMKSRDEITELWHQGPLPTASPSHPAQRGIDTLINGAVDAAAAVHPVIVEALR